jgi:hypothetical protein
MTVQIVPLEGVQLEPAGAEAAAPDRPLRDSPAQRALVGVQVCRQLLDWTHTRRLAIVCPFNA